MLAHFRFPKPQINELPPLRRATLTVAVDFLHDISTMSNVNLMTAMDLAEVRCCCGCCPVRLVFAALLVVCVQTNAPSSQVFATLFMRPDEKKKKRVKKAKASARPESAGPNVFDDDGMSDEALDVAAPGAGDDK